MSWIQKRKQPYQPLEAVVGTVTQKTDKVTKPRANHVQATEAKEEDDAVVEEGAVNKYVADEEGA